MDQELVTEMLAVATHQRMDMQAAEVVVLAALVVQHLQAAVLIQTMRQVAQAVQVKLRQYQVHQ